MAKQPEGSCKLRSILLQAKRGRTRALDVHEVGVRRLYKSLELVPFLLGLEGRVKEINCERLSKEAEGSLPRQTSIVLLAF